MDERAGTAGDEVAPSDGAAVPRNLAVAAAWSWRLLAVALALAAMGWLLAELRLVLIPVLVALLIATLLVPVRSFLLRIGAPKVVATIGTFLVATGVVAGFVAVIVPPLVDEFADLSDTLDEAGDDIEDWLVTGPFDLDRAWVADAREQVVDGAGDVLSNDGLLLDGAQVFGEFVTGMILALVVCIFLVKDGERIQRAALGFVPARHQDRARELGGVTWRALGGYVRAAAMLGIVEGIVIGGTLALVGARLVLPVATLTFVAAFFPFVGAIAAGLVATMVALVTAGSSAAVVVAVVAVVVQQLDNDLLAPVIYGHTLQLHPLVVILGISVGASAAGLTGAFLAVPLVAVGAGVVGALRRPPVVADDVGT